MTTEHRLSLTKTNGTHTPHGDLDGATTTASPSTPELTPEELAEQRYQEELEAARQAGDGRLEGTILQQLGLLASEQGRHALAVTRYKEALACLQTAENRSGEMQTADLLGSAELQLGHHEAARAWYAEAERLARDLGDEDQLGATAQNVGILLQRQALALPDDAEDERRRLLGEAAASVATSLAIDQKRGDEGGAAASLFQLGVIRRHLGDLDEAERHVQQALAFYEPQDLPDVYKVYANLEAIAVARNRPEEAAAWRAKKEAKRADLERPAHGDGPPRLPPQARQAFVALCQAVHAALSTHQPIPPEAANTLAYLVTQPDPVGAAGRFLQRLAAGDQPDPPDGLPPELTEIFSALVLALRALPPASSRPAAQPPPSPPAPPPPSHATCPCGSGKPFLDCHGGDGEADG
jgi:tetratricopeptide (TPR) repeat protein